MMRDRKQFSLVPVKVLAALIALGAPACAEMIISPTFDSTITSSPNAATIEATINSVDQMFEGIYANPITVSIYFQLGGGLGTSDTIVYGVPYTDFYAGLAANNANPAAIAALNANGGDALTNGGINPVGGSSYIEMKSANARALGIDIPPQCVVTATGKGDSSPNLPNECALPSDTNTNLPEVDGIVSLQTSITDPPNSPQSSYYSLFATTEHEIDEILGLGSALENCDPSKSSQPAACKSGATLNASNDTPFGVAYNIPMGTPEDLFRWSAPTGGTRTLSTNCTTATGAYFDYGPNTGEIAQFNNSCNAADFGDWQTGANPQVQDAFSEEGAGPPYGMSEIDAMTAIGYETPEPGTMDLFGAGFALFAFYRRSS
jgi:hypothetical protein